MGDFLKMSTLKMASQKLHLPPLISYAVCVLFSFSLVLASASVVGDEEAPNGKEILHVADSNSNPNLYVLPVSVAEGKSDNFDDTDAPPMPDSYEEELFKTDEPVPISPNKIWAVIVAGSNGYYNYRHQADACHAYQILIRNGVPKNQIITMMYDDVARSDENPTPGIIINRPNGTDVYKGVVIDYKQEDVTPENFIKVLLGDQEGLKGVGSGKVLQSGPDDHVFINFVDHGAPGLVAFPSDELHAKVLEDAFKKMHQSKKYGKLVFYMEACESGSMFQMTLPSHWNIFATTAANGQESSYACYYDEERQTYLGDVYSVNWMENADKSNLDQETLQSQFLVVRHETNTSHVMEFGDKTLRKLPVADFLGYSGTPLTYPKAELDAVPSEDVVPSILQKKLARAQTKNERRELKFRLRKLYKMRKLVTAQMMDIIEAVTGGHGHNMTAAQDITTTISRDEQLYNEILNSRHALKNFECYERVARYYSKHCFSIAKNPYVTRKLYVLVNMCEVGMDSEKIVSAMTNTCHHNGDIVEIH